MKMKNYVDDIREFAELQELIERDFRELDRDLWVFKKGSEQYERFLKSIGYDRTKGSEQLETTQIPQNLKDVVSFVESYTERNTREERDAEDPFIKSNMRANRVGVESMAWDKIKNFVEIEDVDEQL